jgi:hypothetical protein
LARCTFTEAPRLLAICLVLDCAHSFCQTADTVSEPLSTQADSQDYDDADTQSKVVFGENGEAMHNFSANPLDPAFRKNIEENLETMTNLNTLLSVRSAISPKARKQVILMKAKIATGMNESTIRLDALMGARAERAANASKGLGPDAPAAGEAASARPTLKEQLATIPTSQEPLPSEAGVRESQIPAAKPLVVGTHDAALQIVSEMPAKQINADEVPGSGESLASGDAAIEPSLVYRQPTSLSNTEKSSATAPIAQHSDSALASGRFAPQARVPRSLVSSLQVTGDPLAKATRNPPVEPRAVGCYKRFSPVAWMLLFLIAVVMRVFWPGKSKSD